MFKCSILACFRTRTFFCRSLSLSSISTSTSPSTSTTHPNEEGELINIRAIQSQKKTSFFSYKLSNQLNLLFKQGKVACALDLFSSLVQLNNKKKQAMVSSNENERKKKRFLFVRPSVPVYNTLLKGLRDHGCAYLANKIFVDMKKRSLVPDSISYVLLIDSVIQRAIFDSRERPESGSSDYTKQVNDPINFCWDKFQELKSNIPSLEEQENNSRITLNTLIKAVGVLGTKSSAELDVLRLIFPPFEEESYFPLSPSYNIKPSSDTISIAIKAANNLNAPLWFVEGYLQRAISSDVLIDTYIICSILTSYRKYSSNLSLDDMERVLIANKTQNLVEKYIKLPSFRNSALFHGLLMTIYMSCASTAENRRFFKGIIEHYLLYAKSLKDPTCLSLYIQAILLTNENSSFSKVILELLNYRKTFKKWTLESQLEILVHFIPAISSCSNSEQRNAIRCHIQQLEDSEIFDSVRANLKEFEFKMSNSSTFKVKQLIQALKALEDQ